MDKHSAAHVSQGLTRLAQELAPVRYAQRVVSARIPRLVSASVYKPYERYTIEKPL